MPSAHVQTAAAPGAVGIIQLAGDRADLASLLGDLTGRKHWEPNQLYRTPFADVDDGLACLCGARPGAPAQAAENTEHMEPTDGRDAVGQAESLSYLMPHGGPRVIERLCDWLEAHGCTVSPNSPAGQVYPEAESAFEADVLAMVSRAASPAAVDLLLEQPMRWRHWVGLPRAERAQQAQLAQRYATALAHLMTPPIVLVLGRPNVGKSTLTNYLLGRSASVVADLPGTTRDWVGTLAELGEGHRAVAVQWIDTPGLRASDDAIEQRAIALARDLLTSADVLIALCSPDIDWPSMTDLPRQPDLWVLNKADLLPSAPPRPTLNAAGAAEGQASSASHPLHISAETGLGMDALEWNVLGQLGLHALPADLLWPFNDRLTDALLRDDPAALHPYLDPDPS